MLGPGDVTARKTAQVPCLQRHRGNEAEEWDGVSDGSLEGNKVGVVSDKEGQDLTLT